MDELREAAAKAGLQIGRSVVSSRRIAARQKILGGILELAQTLRVLFQSPTKQKSRRKGVTLRDLN
jgi:hypothetical protein